MGVKRAWQSLPFQDISIEELLKKCRDDRYTLALDYLGSFYPQLLDSKNEHWLDVSNYY